jgi:hypothetical protein
MKVGVVFEKLDSRLKFFWFLVMLPWWILGHTQKIFDEMHMRLQEL